MTDSKALLSAAVSMCIGFGSSLALAQGAPATVTTLEEVVVTAQKRSENLQEIPKEVQVVSDTQLRNSNVTGLADLVKLVPSMSGPNSNGMGGLISMRGVGTAAPSVGAAQKVGVVLDDVPVPTRARSAANLLDIAQVEVLPGPQGTLAGRNATGGLVNLVTRKPSRDAMTASFDTSGTGDHDYIAGVYVSAPFNDRFAWSLSGNYQDQRGLAYNIALNKWDVATRNFGARGKLLWTVDDNTEATLAYSHYYELNEGGGVSGWSSIYRQIDIPLANIVSALECISATSPTTPCSTSTAGKKTFTQLLPGITPGPDNVNYYSISRQRTERTGDSASLRYEKSVDAGNFVVIGSWLNEKFPQVQDWLNYPNVNLDLRPEFDGYAHVPNTSKQKTFEARFASRTNQPWTYLGGVFWSDLVNDFEYQRYQQPFWARRVFGSGSTAAFGSTSYTFPSNTTVRGGLRYERDKIDYTWTYFDIPAVTRTLQNGLVRSYPRTFYPSTAGNAKDNYVNYDFGLQQKLREGVMVYLNYAYANQGPIYDSEDIVGSQTASGTGLSPLPAEEVKSIEAGIKSTWYDDRLTVNLNFFDMKFTNYQALTNVTDTANPFAQPILKTYPAGKASSKGVELSTSALLGSHVRVDIAGMYDDAKIDDWKNAPCFVTQTLAEGCLTGIPPGEFVSRTYQANIAGNQLANAPKVKVTAVGTYSNAVSFATGWNYSASLTSRYLASEIGDQLGAPATKLPARTFWDANVTFSKNKLSLSLFGVNLFKEFAETFGTGLGAGLTAGNGSSTGRFPDGSYPIKTRVLTRDNVRYFGARLKYSL